MAANGNEEDEKILHFCFNQDTSCLAVATTKGFRVFACDPFLEEIRRNMKGERRTTGEGVGIIEALFRCQLFGLVGGGPNPCWPPHLLLIWDDHQSKCIAEINAMHPVKAVRLKRDTIVVACEHTVLVYNFRDLRMVYRFDTAANPHGLIALSPAHDQNVLACPGTQKGQVRVELYDVARTKFIAAHTSELACITLSQDGKLLATASERGTLIRIHSTYDGIRLQELRRGADPARIYSIAFSRGEWPDWLAMSSDKGTVHVFALEQRQATLQLPYNGQAEQQQQPLKNPVSSLAFMSGVVPYFGSERSFAQFRLPEESRCIVGFGSTANTLMIASISGAFYTVAFDERKGDYAPN